VGAGGGASLDLQRTCEKGSGPLAGEHLWTYEEGVGLALAKWGLDLWQTSE